MSLMNAPATFQRLMDAILGHFPFVRVYIDDVVIFSRTLEDHLDHLRITFRRLHEHSLKIRISKCFFAQSRVSLLGHVLSEQGVAVDPAKILAIQAAPLPATKTELRSFLGLAGYYRRFICGFATISASLHYATSSSGSIEWTMEMWTAFLKLQRSVTEPPVLAFPDFERPFVVETDASGRAVGAVLAQKTDNVYLRPVEFASRTMNDA